jgi:sensor histidine kinase regulating citrate/malate metabolism
MPSDHGATGHAVRTITTEHQGAVWLEETGPNGATFTVALPIIGDLVIENQDQINRSTNQHFT